MRAWRTAGDGKLQPVEAALPSRRDGELLIKVEACAVCRTDLHVVDGDLPPRRRFVIPGHEVVGAVVAADGDVGPGDLVGIPWLRSTCGTCRWCREGSENLCEQSTYTGWDEDGGYAEYAVAPAAYTYAIPPGLTPSEAAPLLCAGIIGYRALKRAELHPGGRLALFGFGGSAHLTAQLAVAQGAELHVVTRDPAAQRLALDLGAATAAANASDLPPLDSAIVFAPSGEVARDALAALGPHGTVAIAGIYSSDIPTLDYQRHLFGERTITTVTSNTRADGEEFLRLAQRVGVRATITPYAFDRADAALDDLRNGHVNGVAVLTMP
ncbi:MAG: zinc-binding alcohol dehydrogenase family protein [Marmoricola sp.]